MEVIDDQIVLVGQPAVTAERDPVHGLYTFDPESGEFSLLYEIPGARLGGLLFLCSPPITHHESTI